ncbi:MAG: hypothetical protein ABFD92_08595 [Planctomycetaceae bacterium]|nr:hypothetical protein [Planctomycetaceae bacterium]
MKRPLNKCVARTPVIMASVMCLWGCGPEVRKQVQPPQSATRATTEVSRNARALEALDQNIKKLDFEEIEFKDVIQFIQGATGLNIYVRWGELSKVGMGKQGSTVTFHEEDMTVRRCLELCLANATNVRGPLAYRIADGKIIISTAEDAEKMVAMMETAPGVAKDTPRNKAVSDAIQQRIKELNFDGIELKDIIQFMRDISGQNIYVSRSALRRASAPVTVHLQDVTLHQAILLCLEAAQVDPPLDYVVAGGVIVISTPRELKKISAMLESSPMAASGTPRNAAVRGKLEQRIKELKFDDIELEDVIQFMRDVSGQDIYVNWHALSQAGISRSTPVNVHVRGVTVHQGLLVCLKDVAGEESLGYEIADGVVIVSTCDDAKRLTKQIETPPVAAQPADEPLAKRMMEAALEKEHLKWLAQNKPGNLPGIELQGIELDDSIGLIRDLSKVDISPDLASLHAVGIGFFSKRLSEKSTLPRAATVTVDIGTDVSLHTALTLILDSAGQGKGLTYRIENGKVILSVPKPK